MRTPTVLLIASASLAGLASCGERRGANEQPAVAGEFKVLATVNGVRITESDVNHSSRKAVMGAAPGHDVSGNVLQTVVRDELIYQEAVQLGLDREPGYRRRLEDLEAQLRAFQRHEMAGLYRRYVQDHAAVTDADARAYFDGNASLLRTRFHVLQIFHKRRYDEILKDHRDVKSGAGFEEVAARRFPRLPDGEKPPWDLGELSWHRMPPSWRGIVDRLEPGQVSDVIQGENDRFWVIKLVSRKVDPGITFDSEKERIVQVLRQQKADELHASMLAEMKRKASIVYSK